MSGGYLKNKSKTPEYQAWASMRQRCLNPKSQRFHDYGGRGITVCKEWESFEQFYADMGPRPSSDHSIDRIDNDSGYSPVNCKWSTRSEQQKNKRPYDPSNLPHGDDHWTRRDRERAREISANNIRKAHGSGEKNPNSKLTSEEARRMRDVFSENKSISMTELGSIFGVGRETARKVIKGEAW